MKGKVHYLHPGPFAVHIGFTTCPAAFDHEMKRLGVKDGASFHVNDMSHAATHFVRLDHGGLCCIIAMPPHSNKHSREQYASLLAHEALHVVQRMRELNHDDPFDHETEAYLLQYIVQECLAIAWKSGKTRAIRPLPSSPKGRKK